MFHAGLVGYTTFQLDCQSVDSFLFDDVETSVKLKRCWKCFNISFLMMLKHLSYLSYDSNSPPIPRTSTPEAGGHDHAEPGSVLDVGCSGGYSSQEFGGGIWWGLGCEQTPWSLGNSSTSWCFGYQTQTIGTSETDPKFTFEAHKGRRCTLKMFTPKSFEVI